MNSYSCVRNSGRVFSACALAATFFYPFAQAQIAPGDEPERLQAGGLRPDVSAETLTLDPVVVSATRTPARASQLGSAVEVITAEETSRRQVTTLSQALESAGATPVHTGAVGGTTSLFMRGANSTQTLILVDGIRASDSNALYANFIGAGAPLGTDRIEVVRGPQSTMYGSDAIGGAVSIAAQRGSGAPSAVQIAA